MVKYKVNPVRKYYSYDHATKRSSCQVRGCTRVISGNHASNLGRHIKRFHPDQYMLLTFEKEGAGCGSVSSSPSSSHSHYNYNESNNTDKDKGEDGEGMVVDNEGDVRSADHGKLDSPADDNYGDEVDHPSGVPDATTGNASNDQHRPTTPAAAASRSTGAVKVKMSRDALVEAVVEMVTVNGRPFDLINDSGFRKILDPLIKATSGSHRSAAGAGRSLTCPDVEAAIAAKAKSIRQSTKRDLEGRVLGLKVDLVVGNGTRHNSKKAVMAIGVQYVDECPGGGAGEESLKLRTLTASSIPWPPQMVTCASDVVSTADRAGVIDSLTRTLVKTLGEYGIGTWQISAMVVDTLAPKSAGGAGDPILNFGGSDVNYEDNGDTSLSEDYTSSSENTSCVDDDDSCTQNAQAASGMSDIGTTTSIERLVMEACHRFEGPCYISQNYNYDRCSARALECVLTDSVADPLFKTDLNKARSVVKKLRNPTYMLYLKKLQLPLPIMDGSPDQLPLKTVEMVDRLLKLREFCEDFGQLNPDLHLDSTEWDHLKCIREVWLPVRSAIESYRAQTMSINDFYGTWLRCGKEVASIKTAYARWIAGNMRQKQVALFENPSFCASLYLDPRFNAGLSEEDKVKAEECLYDTWMFLQRFERGKRLSGKNDDDGENDDDDEMALRNPDPNDTEVESVVPVTCHKMGAEGYDSCTREGAEEYLRPSLRAFLTYRPPPETCHDDGVKFWHDHKHAYPDLCRLARALTTIPATGASIRRAVNSFNYVGCNAARGTNAVPSSALLNDILLIRNHYHDNVR